MTTQKTIIILMLCTALLVGAFYLFSDKFGRREQKGAMAVEKPDPTNPWKKFDNEYLSFAYPPNWILEQLPRMNKEAVHMRLVSPKQIPEHSSLYIMAISIYGADEYVSTFDANDIRKNEIKQLIQEGNLKEFSGAGKHFVNNIFVHNDFEYNELFQLNGANALISFSGNDKVLSGPRITFLSRGNIIKIVVLDISDVPNPVIASLQKDFLKVYDDRAYGEILRSLVIKQF